jgi:PAS domain S-box-containing protein
MIHLKEVLEGGYSEILDSITDGYWVLYIENDEPSGEEYLSPKFKSEFGYKDDELPNSTESWLKIIYPDDAKRALDAFYDHLHDGKPYRLVVKYRHKNGNDIWILCRGFAVKKDGKWWRMLGTHTNITSLKETEANHSKLTEALREIQFSRVQELLDKWE